MSILFSHIRFMQALKVQGMSRNDLPWKSPGGAPAAWTALIVTGVVTLFKGFDAFTPKFNHKTFITSYLGLPLYAALYFGYKFYYKSRIIPLHEVDLVTGRREFDEDEAMWAEKEAANPPSFWRRLWDMS